MSHYDNEPAGNGGHEAYRVHCRFWPQDMLRRMYLDAMVRKPDAIKARNAGQRNAKRPTRSWVCSKCKVKNHDRGWCGICGTKRDGG